MANQDEVLQWRGQKVVDAEGGKLGKVEEIYLDTETEQPEWLQLNLSGLTGGSAFLPVQGVRAQGGDLQAPFTKDKVKAAPGPGADGELSQQDEAALYEHYNLSYGESRSDSGLPEGGTATTTTTDRDAGARGSVGDDVSGRETDNAMTRSEEELRVGTERREAGRARLRKFVTTEQVEKTVPVQREEVRVEREPITDANVGQATSGPAISEEEHEVVLNEERAVVGKEAVPKERVRLDKDVTTEEQRVSEEVRKENIEMVDGRDEPAQGIDGVRGTDEGVR